MIIGIDGNEANVTNKVGISEFAFQLLLQFSNLKSSKFNIYLKSKPKDDLPKPDNNWQYRTVTPGKLWTQWRLPLDLYLHQPRPNVFFSPTHYAPRFSPVPTVISIMDLSYLYFPKMFKKSDLYQLRSWTSYSAKKAQRVLTISNSSKFAIIKEYKIPEDKVIVVYPGIKPARLPAGQAGPAGGPTVYREPKVLSMNTVKAKYGISDKFILFVGTLQPRKNIVRLIEAFAKVLSQEKIPKNLQLLIVGKKGWLYEEILRKPKELGIEEKVKFLDFVSDDELAVLYNNALCFILPSLYEGFGLPVLEAMKHGCPVITSNVSSLPEAGGDAAIYIDPEDINDLTEKILKLITNEKLRQELIEKGKKQAAKFSWEKTATETLKVLEEVGSLSSRPKR